MNEIRDVTFTSKKTLERYFLDQIGLSPKRYARICRFNKVKSLLDRCPSRDWQDAALPAGYYDQSHFIREFKEFSGKTPGEYIASREPEEARLFS